MKIVVIVVIVCASTYSQVVPDLPSLLGAKKPDPEVVEAEIYDCLIKEYQPLANLAVTVVVHLSVTTMGLSGCVPPKGYVKEVRLKIQDTLNNFVVYEANNCSQVIGDEIRKAITKEWNVITQTACVLDINEAVEDTLAEGALNALNSSVADVQSLAHCQNPSFPKTFRHLLKLVYDRIALIGTTITTLNVQNIFAGLKGCVTVPVIDLTVPV